MSNHIVDEASRWKMIPLSDLIPADWNYKEEDSDMDTTLEEGINEFGVVMNLIVREVDSKYEVVNGNHRLPIVGRTGRKQAMCYNLGDIPLELAKKIAVATNELRYETNQMKLSELMHSINQMYSVDDLLKTMPFDREHIEAMIQMPSFDPSQYNVAPEAEEQESNASSGAYHDLRLSIDAYNAIKEQLNRLTELMGEAFENEEATYSSATISVARILSTMTDEDISKVIRKRAAPKKKKKC